MGLDALLYSSELFEPEETESGEVWEGEEMEDEPSCHDPFGVLIQRAMEVVGANPAEVRVNGFSEEEECGLGRAYGMRYFADYVRSEQLPMLHMSKLTLSQWEIILPVPFVEPMPMLPGGEGEAVALGLPPRDPKWDNPEKALEEHVSASMRALGMGPDQLILGSGGGAYGYPGYLSYYLGTRFEDLYCFSAPAILAEIAEWLLEKGVLIRPESGPLKVAEDHPDTQSEWAQAALLTCSFCQEAVRLRRALILSG